jgi:hypothetical protein
MLKFATFVTRFVSFMDDLGHPAELRLSAVQSLEKEDPPSLLPDGRIQRYIYIRGPVDAPIALVRNERLPDGTVVPVRYVPDVDLACER